MEPHMYSILHQVRFLQYTREDESLIFRRVKGVKLKACALGKRD